MKRRTILFFIIISTLGLFVPALAQRGVISGKVFDSDGRSTLPGASVFIKGDPTKGTVTDIDGSFILNNAPAGQQVVVVSFLGYESQEVPVMITDGGLTQTEVILQIASIMGQEVIVSAQLLGQAKAINQQLNAESIVNIISSDRIQELPDVNAAEAIARLPGIAINRSGGEGQKVVIRGMEPKFSAIMVNGVRLPSNSSEDRSVDLSLISPELLDGIEVFKSPLPDMDAEAIGGTVNLRLRKAPRETHLLLRALGGYNQLHDDTGDYKGVLQFSRRVFNNKVGVVTQVNVERFNRGGDFLTNTWREGPTNDSTGITEILGNTLRYEDRQEIRKRRNGSLNLDYQLGKNNFNLFALYSRTERSQFSMQERYFPQEPSISYVGRGIDNSLELLTTALTGEHAIGKLKVDWATALSRTHGATPYDYFMRFIQDQGPFRSGLDAFGHPSTFPGAANPNLANTYLREGDFNPTSTNEDTRTFAINLQLPVTISKGIGGYFKFGGKYNTIDRVRKAELFSESFYFLGGDVVSKAAAQYPEPLIYVPGSQRISIVNFLQDKPVAFEAQDGTPIDFNAHIDPNKIRFWLENQRNLLNKNREVLVDNYEVAESITAGYAMLRLNFGKKLTLIPGFRYEYSNNEYRAGISSLSGRYGINGFFQDTVSTQRYGELLPHLHLKFQPVSWFDIRASYAATLARPDFIFITPRAQINTNDGSITAGNPNLNYARATNYDLFFSAFKGGLGLLTFGMFYKAVDDIFYPWVTQLVDRETAAANGWEGYNGYELTSYRNSDQSRIYGYEVDLQTNLSFLPSPFNGFVINANYSRLYSETQVFFLTSETRLLIPFPPVLETVYTNSSRTVGMPSQAPHIFNMSVGYDYKTFSLRVSSIYQGTKADGFSANKDFDRFSLGFWRWDASLKQRVGKHWSLFLNMNNFTNQRDITFTRTENFLNTIQTFGRTGTIGLQYKL